MLNYIWSGLLLMGFAVGIINGRIGEVTSAVVESAAKAVEFGIGLLGIMCLWTGMMKIAEKSGMISAISGTVKPALKLLFPGISSSHPAMGAIIMNLTANFLGLGNAATPFGIKAMQELQKLNPARHTASNAMCMFLVLNTSAVQLIPATIIAVRSSAGSQSPADIIGTIWVSSFCAFITGIIAIKFFRAIAKSERNRLWQ